MKRQLHGLSTISNHFNPHANIALDTEAVIFSEKFPTLCRTLQCRNPHDQESNPGRHAACFRTDAPNFGVRGFR